MTILVEQGKMKVIVPLHPKNFVELIDLVSRINHKVDIVEIWLDQIFSEFVENPNLIFEAKTLLKKVKQTFGVEVLATCKSPTEKGAFVGSSEERLMVLQNFLRLGGDFVDLDILKNTGDVVAQIPSENLWLSFHHFEENPDPLPDLEGLFHHMQTFNPFLYKFAIAPKDQAELEAFILFAKTFPERGVFTTMGLLGSQGREKLVPISWGGFYALDENHLTATGQSLLSDIS